MTKAELRTAYKARRAALAPHEVAYLSERIAGQFFGSPAILDALNVPGAVVHTYLPIRRQNEVDTWPIIRRIWADFPLVRACSSVTDVVTKTMRSFLLQPSTSLTENRWGIPEPTPPVAWTADIPTIVLVPLLAFDRQGHRVGYGGGYYDRFLASLPPGCLIVGLSLLDATDALIDDLEPTDVPLHGCVTTSGINWFTKIG